VSASSRPRFGALVFTVILALLVVALPGLVATPAFGGAPRVVSKPGEHAELAVDRQGTTTLVWAVPNRSHAIYAMRRPAHGRWRAPVRIGRGMAPVVATDAAGTVTVAWLTNSPGMTTGVAAARRPAGGRWQQPVHLSDDREFGGYPSGERLGAHFLDLAVSPRGHIVVAWAWGTYETDRAPLRVQAVYRSARGRWSEVMQVTGATGATEPAVAVDRHGVVVVVYAERPGAGPTWSLKSRVRVPGTGWTKAARLAGPTWTHDVAVDRHGDALAVYTSGQRVKSRTRPAGGSWLPARVVSSPRVYNDMAMAMNHRGVAVVAWVRDNGRVFAAQGTSAGKWSTPLGLSARRSGSQPFAAVNARGDMFVGWGSAALYGKYRAHGASWGNQITVVRDMGESVEHRDCIVRPDGSVIVAWEDEVPTLRLRLMTPPV
jgi:hypothetical protein